MMNTRALALAAGLAMALSLFPGCNEKRSKTDGGYDDRDPGIRNTFRDALMECEKAGRVVLESGKSGNCGYAILADAKPPTSDLSFALIAVCHDDFYLGSDSDKDVWASIATFHYELSGKELKLKNLQTDRGLKPVMPVREIASQWQTKWDEYLRRTDLILPKDERAKATALLSEMQGPARGPTSQPRP